MKNIKTVLLVLAVTLFIYGENSQEHLFRSKFLPVVYENSGTLTIIGESGRFSTVTIFAENGDLLYSTTTKNQFVTIPLRSLNDEYSNYVIKLSGENGSTEITYNRAITQASIKTN